MLLNKANILQAVARRTKDEPSAIFGGDLRIQEITRAEWRAVSADAALPPNAAGEAQMNTDKWYGGFFALMVVEPDTGKPMFTFLEVMAFPERDDLWGEVRRLAQVGLDLSEVGADFLPAPSEG